MKTRRLVLYLSGDCARAIADGRFGWTVADGEASFHKGIPTMKVAVRLVVVLVLTLGVGLGPARAEVFFSEDFDNVADDDALTAAGWAIVNTPTAAEQGAAWTVTNPGKRDNPPKADGTPSSEKFVISDSDFADDDNPQDDGASHDLTTPVFSTRGSKAVWLHANVVAVANNNHGSGIFEIDVSPDNGATWSNAWLRIQPGRGTDTRAATTRLPNTTNAGGFHGPLDINLSSLVADSATVKVRFRHYEPNDDWWFAFDDLVIDDVAPPTPGNVVAFSEQFASGLGKMVVAGKLTGDDTWNTECPASIYQPGKVDDDTINRIGHPAQKPEFAVIAPLGRTLSADEYLMTPVLNLSGLSAVCLSYQDENRPAIGSDVQRVLLIEDSNDNGVPEVGDKVLKVIYNYQGGALGKGAEAAFYAERLLAVPEAAGRDAVFFAWNYQLDNKAGNWWAIDNIVVSGRGAAIGEKSLAPELSERPHLTLLLVGAVFGTILVIILLSFRGGGS